MLYSQQGGSNISHQLVVGKLLWSYFIGSYFIGSYFIGSYFIGSYFIGSHFIGSHVIGILSMLSTFFYLKESLLVHIQAITFYIRK